MKNKLRLFVLALAIGISMPTLAQVDNVGIGTDKPNQSAVLDLQSNNKGLLMPRLTSDQKNSIKNPATGLIIYQTDLFSGFYFYNGSYWKPIVSESKSVVAADPTWLTSGNSGNTFYHPTSNPTGNSIGNTDNIPVVLRTGASFSGWFDSGSKENVFLGYNTGITATLGANTGSYNTALGYNTFLYNTTGSSNSVLGRNALLLNTSGSNNVAVGTSAMQSNQNGNFNMALGGNSLKSNTSGASNMAIGFSALENLTTGSNNVAIGTRAGGGKNGFGNIYIGSYAGEVGGATVTEDNKLYIHNVGVPNPLIKGDFAQGWMRINSKTTGYLVIGDFDTVPSGTPGTGGVPLPPNIGTAGGYRLVVQDGILTEKIKVALRSTGGDWADYVFEPEYKAKMMTLEEVEKFTLENKHLPNVLSEKEMVKEGLDVAKTSKMFMEKIEELTLYMIEMNKEIKALKAENELLKRK